MYDGEKADDPVYTRGPAHSSSLLVGSLPTRRTAGF